MDKILKGILSALNESEEVKTSEEPEVVPVEDPEIPVDEPLKFSVQKDEPICKERQEKLDKIRKELRAEVEEDEEPSEASEKLSRVLDFIEVPGQIQEAYKSKRYAICETYLRKTYGIRV